MSWVSMVFVITKRILNENIHFIYFVLYVDMFLSIAVQIPQASDASNIIIMIE